MEEFLVDWLAVAVAAILYLVVGGVWYSKILFGPAWEKLSGVRPNDMPRGAGPIIGSVMVAFIIAFFLAYFEACFDVTTVSDGMYLGSLIWLGFVATTQIGPVIWGKMPFRLFLINTGAKLLSFLVMGGIIGA